MGVKLTFKYGKLIRNLSTFNALLKTLKAIY
jgi:hypothetical protein